MYVPSSINSNKGAKVDDTRSVGFTHSAAQPFIYYKTTTKSTTYTHSKNQPFITVDTEQKKPPAKKDTSDNTAFTYAPASSMKFNLPPHEWSLPIDPSLVNSDLSKPKTDHGLRRARLWFYGSSTTTSGVNLVSSTGGTKPKNVSQTFTTTAEDNYWGFQFLWNPTTIQTAVSRQANFTPSSTDALAGLQGLFTAMETVQFTIVLDRINDFAWIKNGGSINSLSQVDTTTLAGIATASDNPYKAGGQIGVYQDQGQQVIDLLNKGTMADVEYLFRAINGIGVGGKAWTNALGRETADIGFLTPNPIALQLGPTGDSLSYVGWIDALAIQHSVFTENMVPLHTEIQVTFNVFSKVSLQSGN